MTDRDAQRRALLDLALALLILVPFGVVTWTTTGPAEALGLPALAVWFFCRRWVDVRIDADLRWKHGDKALSLRERDCQWRRQ